MCNKCRVKKEREAPRMWDASLVSESQSYDVAHTPLGAVGQVGIAETAYVLDMPDLEDVVDANDELGIGTVGVHNVTTLGEVHQTAVAAVLLQKRIVLVAQ